MDHKLKVGLLIDTYSVPAWAYAMVEKINSSSHSEIVLIVKKDNPPPPKKSILKRLWEHRKTLLYSLYTKLEDKIFRLSHDAFELKDLGEIVDCRQIPVTTRETKFSDFILEEDIEKIEAEKVDVFIRLGFKILRGAILHTAKYGVWSYHHGDNAVNRGGPAGTWEVLNKIEETGVILQILTEDLDGGVKLAESFSTTDTFSFKRNKNNYYWKALEMVPRQLSELYRLGEERFFERIKARNDHPYFYYNRLYTTPTNRQLLKGVFRNVKQVLWRKVEGLFYFNQWVLLFKLERQDTISRSFFRFKRILPPKDRFWADPFVIREKDRYYIFMEELIFKENKGKIAVIEMDEKGNYGEPVVVLEKDYHLSYPFLFKENDTLYMIPETAQNRTIELYECIEFPLRWELKEILLNDIYAVDSTLVRHEGKYWIFCNTKENQGTSSLDELSLFHSDRLLGGTWMPHTDNPIVSDVKYARPAGNILKEGGRMYRPSQNNSKHYGYGMQIHEITELTVDSYKEKHIQSIYPNWAEDLLSTHTLNHDGKLTVIDALIKRKKF